MRWMVFFATIALQASVLMAQFADEHIIAPLERLGDLLTGDVDNNGTTDIVSCGPEGPILLYRGSGSGAFLAPEIIALHGYIHYAESGLVDIDGDEDLDVLYHDDFDAMRLLRNDGSGIFAAPEVACPLITEGVNNGMHFRDLDGDSDVDIVFSRDNVSHNQIVWYANNGSGTFSFMGIVASTTNSASWILPADLDGDGDVDLIASRETDDNLLRYDNDGNGVFSAATVLTSGAQYSTSRLRAADVNMDGREDICYNDGERKVRLLLSNTGGFDPAVLLYTSSGPYLNGDVRLADMDGGGTTDVVFCDQSELIGYFPNPGNGAFPAVPDTLIHQPRSNLGAYFVTADMDDNGVQDIVLKAINALVYFPDQGGESMGLPKTLSRAMSPGSLLMADLDQDGDPDAISMDAYVYNASGSILLAAMNDGTGVFARPDTIMSFALDFGFSTEPWQVHDMDDDGDQDILLMDYHPYMYHISWLMNNGTGYFDSLVVIMDDARTYELVDLDQDGQEDILAIWGPDNVGWFRGLGAGVFDAFIDLGQTTEQESFDLTAGDADNDGDQDILVVSGNGQSNYVFIFENEGNAVFGTPQPYFFCSSADRVQLADIDGDGLLDPLLGSALDWYKNQGGLQFSYMGSLINQGAPATNPATDMDGDGDLDILSTYSRSIRWRQNQGAGNFAPETELATVHGIPALVNYLDVDGDGLRDLAYALLADSVSGPYAYCPGWIGGTGAPLAIHTTANAPAMIFPSPFSQSATIQLAQPLLPDERLLLLDGTGRTVRVLSASGSDRIILERGDLPSGLYLIQRQTAQRMTALGRVVVN